MHARIISVNMFVELLFFSLMILCFKHAAKSEPELCPKIITSTESILRKRVQLASPVQILRHNRFSCFRGRYRLLFVTFQCFAATAT